MPDVFLETPRLVLRRVTAADEDALVELDSDPAVMRHVNGGRPTSRAWVRDEIIPGWLRYYERFTDYGFWIAVEKATGAFLGWFHFRPHPDGTGDGIELGYRLRRPAWGAGYATEGSIALVEHGFTTTDLVRVYAEAFAANAASRRVMEKAGLRQVRTSSRAAGAVVEYALTRPEWERRPTPAT